MCFSDTKVISNHYIQINLIGIVGCMSMQRRGKKKGGEVEKGVEKRDAEEGA